VKKTVSKRIRHVGRKLGRLNFYATAEDKDVEEKTEFYEKMTKE
jgi:hypothetical protein